MLATIRSRTDLTAGDLMSRDLVSVSQETPMREAGRLLLLHQISGLPVVEADGTCVGVLSTTDFLRWQITNVEQSPTGEVGQYMTLDPATVTADTPLTELAQRMADAHIHRVLVVDRLYRLVGIISSTDVLAGIVRAGQTETEARRSFAPLIEPKLD